MSLEVTVGEEYLSPVLGDLAQRRGGIRDIQSRHDDKVLLASVPLAEMMVSGREPCFTVCQISCLYPLNVQVGFDPATLTIDLILLRRATLQRYEL